VTESGPAEATALAGISAVSSVLLTTVVAMALPFHCTVAPERKFEPATLRVKTGPPCWLLFGDIAWMIGGFGGGLVAPPLPPHPN
jgi:hypothetical protein